MPSTETIAEAANLIYYAHGGTGLPAGWSVEQTYSFINGDAYIAYDAAGDTAALVFEGSQGTLQFLDLLQALSPIGQLSQYAVVYPIIQAFLDYVDDNNITNVLVTGYSIGGAMAELFAAYEGSDSRLNGVNVEVITFGSMGIAVDAGNIVAISTLSLFNGEDPAGNQTFEIAGVPLSSIFSFNGIHLGVDLPTLFPTDMPDGEFGFHEHGIAVYAAAWSAIASSPAGADVDWLTTAYHPVIDLRGSSDSIMSVGGESGQFLLLGRGGNDILTGSSAHDRIDGGAGNDNIYGGGGWDSLWGSAGSDTIRGEAGNDNIAGGADNDTLIGGTGADRYSIGVGEGIDTIDDQGAIGAEDVLALFIGSLATSIDASWFTVEGTNLRVRVPNGSGGYAIDVLIANMNSPQGSIETVELFVGDDTEASDTFDLDAFWAAAHQLPVPDEPVDAGGTGAPSSGFTYTGGSGNDIFAGTTGEDVARGLGGNDALGGGNDDDILLGNAGWDVLNGGDGDDLLIDDDPGNFGDDYLDGGAGNDRLVFYGAPEGAIDEGEGGSGEDLALIDVSDSNDDWRLSDTGGIITIRPDDPNDGGEIVLDDVEIVAVLFGDGDDTGLGDDAQFYFEGGGGNDQLAGGLDDDYIDGGSGDDNLDGDGGADWIDGGSGFDRAEMDLSSVSQDITYFAAQAMTSVGFTFVNGAHLRNVEQVELITGSGNDRLWLGINADDVTTGAGNDIISTQGRGRDVVDGGDGVDRVVIDFSWSATRINSNTSGGYSVGTSFTSATDRVSTSNIEEFDVTGGSGNDLLRGYDGDDVLTGNAGNDTLVGNGGDDVLRGGAGDDSLYLGEGSVDWADGGSGNDRGNFDESPSSLSFYFDVFQAASSAGLTLANGTFVRNIEVWDIGLGSGDDTVTMPLNGDSAISMGTGDNHLIIDQRGSAEAFTAGLGLWVGVTQYLAFDGANYDASVDRLHASSVDRVTVYGGDGNDALNGIAGADLLFGGGGSDSLSGDAGNDRLDGGGGADTMIGGDGDDTYVVDNAGDVTTEESALGGVDTVQSSVTRVLGANLEDLTLTGAAAIAGYGNALNNAITGNSAANTLVGGDGNDMLDGGAGADAMTGNFGDDTYYVDNAGDTVSEGNSVGGTDSVFASVSFSLAATGFADHLTLTGAGAINGTGNSLANTITGNSAANVLSGNAGNDMLNAGDGADTLYGGDGVDVLDGGAGADVMIGNFGNDTYYVADAGDVVLEGNIAGGTDQVFASVTFNLGPTGYADHLTLTGASNIDGFGNILGNTIIGNGGVNALWGNGGDDTLLAGDGADSLYGGDGADSLDGGTGADTMIGNFGNDTYYVDNAGDIVSEGNAAGGTDTVFASVSFHLGPTGFADHLTLTGAAAINATGNSLANTLTGNAAANVLTGNAGNDTLNAGDGADTLYGGDGNDTLDSGAGADAMIGNAGDDAYYVDDAGDTVSEGSNVGGTDHVYASVSFNLAPTGFAENLTLTGTDAINATGNNLANTLTGNAGANTLTGAGGADSFVFASALGGGNVDAIADFSVADDTIVLNNSVFAGLSAGALDAGAFVIGSAAADADDCIIYDSATGSLYFDADGAGGADQILFATLTAGLALNNADFIVGGP